MIAIDTNLLIRFLTRDEERQFQKAQSLFANAQIFIPVTVILETVWVLENVYEYPPGDIVDAIRRLLGISTVTASHLQSIHRALEWYEDALDFADALHLALSQHAERFATFDGPLVRGAPEKGNSPVIRP